jgi:hypothetical protein
MSDTFQCACSDIWISPRLQQNVEYIYSYFASSIASMVHMSAKGQNCIFGRDQDRYQGFGRWKFEENKKGGIFQFAGHLK